MPEGERPRLRDLTYNQIRRQLKDVNKALRSLERRKQFLERALRMKEEEAQERADYRREQDAISNPNGIDKEVLEVLALDLNPVKKKDCKVPRNRFRGLGGPAPATPTGKRKPKILREPSKSEVKEWPKD